MNAAARVPDDEPRGESWGIHRLLVMQRINDLSIKTKEIDTHMESIDRKLGALEDEMIESRVEHRYKAMLWGTLGGCVTAIIATIVGEVVTKLLLH